MYTAIIAAVSAVIGKLVDKAVPDKTQANKLKFDLVTQLNTIGEKELEGAMNIIVAEAKGESWLQRNWRPLTMLTFLALLLLYWVGIQPDNLSQETLNKLFDLLKIGIGGYIGGRTIEKGLKTYTEGMKK